MLVVHVVATLFSFSIDSPAPSAPQPPLEINEKIGLYLDIWVMPVVLLLLLYWIGSRLNGSASLKNILWVFVWSQLPVIVLSIISMPMELAGMNISEPLFANKLTTENGQLFIDPPMLQLNADGVVYFVLSTVLFLWSFQILLSGVAAVSGVTVKRALWFLTLAMIALMIARLPFTVLLGDRDLLDILGLKGILEL